MTEKDIIKGCLQGKASCQEALFHKYSGRMFLLCKRYARHEMEAEDMLQDGFIKVFEKLHQFRGEGALEYWIRRIMINTALKHYRKSSFQKEQIGLEEYHDSPKSPDAYQRLGKQELLDLISQLPDGYRLVFNLYAIEGYSHKEVAQTLNIAESTSRSQLVKARRLLQEKIALMQKIAI